MRMRRRASSRFQIGIFPQRFSTPSVFIGAVRTSASSRRRHRRIFLASSRGRRSRSGSVRRSRSEVEFPARLRLSSSSSPSSRSSEAGGVDGRLSPRHSALADAEVVPGPSPSSSGGSAPPADASGSSGPDIRPLSASSSSSSHLEASRRLHGLHISVSSLANIGGGWRGSTTRRYDRVWECFNDFLHSRGLALHSVDVSVVADFLSFLFESGRAYRSITVHRSSLSSILPLFDGVSVGNLPVLSILCRGFFNQRPPSRRLFPSWNVASVFAVF